MVKERILDDILKSWTTREGIHGNDELLAWIAERKETLRVDIKRIRLDQCLPWFYDKQSGSIVNESRSFFSICGIRQISDTGNTTEQPVILQNEIGFLGIICKRIEGVLHFLMQAKIEPGNLNTIQVSPTIQATKSNFTQKHGGNKPPYLDFFINVDSSHIIVDQIQSEQSSRFYKKRNRNIIIYLENDVNVDVLPGYRWMTLGQIKGFMRKDNMVNMDTRTVLSCLPVSMMTRENNNLHGYFSEEALYRSMMGSADMEALTRIYYYINDFKMFEDFETELIDLYSLDEWRMQNDMFICNHPYPFRVIFCDIAIEGREVKRWTQPLFEAVGHALFGLLCCEDAGKIKFLVRAMPEIGCLDAIEIGPSIQREPVFNGNDDVVARVFFDNLAAQSGVLFDTMLSEEGGRFYHEQNHNVMIKVRKQSLPVLPKGYFWVDYSTLNMMTQVNNCLNIQLRNLLSVLEVF